MCCSPHISFFFFFNDTATTEIYTLSLHDALPIFVFARCSIASGRMRCSSAWMRAASVSAVSPSRTGTAAWTRMGPASRSEEHTSELQSHSDLVCRLLLEKKKRNQRRAELTCRKVY